MSERRIKTANLTAEDLELAKSLPRAYPGKHKDREGISRTLMATPMCVRRVLWRAPAMCRTCCRS